MDGLLFQTSHAWDSRRARCLGEDSPGRSTEDKDSLGVKNRTKTKGETVDPPPSHL